MNFPITVNELRSWFEDQDDESLEDLLDNGLEQLIYILEEDDYFGTEGFNKRFQ